MRVPAVLPCLLLLASALALASVPACPSCSGRPSVQLDELEAIATGNYVRVVSNAHARSLGVSFGPSTSAHWFTDWTRATIDASGLDHKPGFGEHNGPGRSSRAVALAVIAMYDAVVAVKGAYSSYCPGIVPGSHPNADARVAIAYAAHSTLSRLFTKQTATFDSLLASSLQYVPAGAKFDEGRALGQQAADCIWTLRLNDSSSTPEPVIGSGPGQYSPPVGPMLWQKDPISQKPAAVGAYWASVTPFALTHASQFRTAPPPAFSSPQWEADYNTVKSIGAKHSTTRTADQSLAGYYWAYDGLPSLCAPPRLYNQIAMQIAAERCLNLTETARFLAVLNVALADSGIAAWDSKYFYNLARPITGVRLNDDAVYGDQNPATVGDPSWEPLGAPASNTGGVDFTPPFPAYPSGHAVFGGALFQVLRTYFGDNYPFTFVSDEYNGETKGSDGSTRPVLPRSFQSFSQAELENGASRIYLGIHWQCDCDNGIGQGNSIANYVMQNLFRKL